MFFKKIIAWYRKNKRDLPWRNTKDPYKIWLSEIILQQTRVAQGLPYYNKFIENYPNVKQLADADSSEVLRLWQGLGYYSRGRNLHKTAKHIINEYEGTFPTEYKDLLKLPGVGQYTAAAIASFSFNKRIPVVDGNVLRVISRYFGLEDPIDIPSTIKTIYSLSLDQISEANPSDYNQAVMELGAMICTPKSPDCLICPVNLECVARIKNLQNSIPAKSKKTSVKTRQIQYAVLVFEESIWLKKRENTDIWADMYDFLLIKDQIIETPQIDYEGYNKLKNQIEYKESFKKQIMHKLTHRNLIVEFEVFNLTKNILFSNGAYYNFEKVEALPKPKIINDMFIEIMEKWFN